MRSRLNYIAQLVVVLGGALSMKFYYSAASVNQLRWILAPTTVLVEFVTGRHFTFESHAGYMSSDHTFLIAASCAGVNFLITAFLMLTIRHFWLGRLQQRNQAYWRQWALLPFAAVMAYATTLVANTARISIALQMQQRSFKVSWLDAEQLHRLEGIVVYFGFLLLLFVLGERTRSAWEREVGSVTRRFSLLRVSFFPLLIYYAMTLGVPLANGAYGQRSFWEHAVFVVLAPMVVILFIGLLANLTKKFHPTRRRRYRLGRKSHLTEVLRSIVS
jgi:exosortase K